jgi:hypothetical protein
MACFMHDSSKETGAKQAMELNGTIFGKELVITVLVLFIFGTLYNHGIEKFPWLAQRRSAEQVVGGVLITVLASGFVIGWSNVIAMLILFSASGLPMLIGSWVRAAQDEQKALEIHKEVLKK